MTLPPSHAADSLRPIDLPATDPYYGHALKDRPILAIDRVRFVGEPVVAVAAESPTIADEAVISSRKRQSTRRR